MHRLLRVTLLALWLPALAVAQSPREARVQFEAGETGSVIEDRIRGDQIIDYLLRAGGGQTLRVDFQSGNPSGYFNLLKDNAPAALHIGSRDGNRFQGVLPEDGDYRLRVYLMRNAARRDETADFRLAVEIDAATAPRDPDFADGLSGGPDFWAVANLAAGDTLNVRSGPSTGHAIVGELASGDTARNLGCEMAEGARWCRIEAGLEPIFTGWVNGRYLVESTDAPGGAAVSTESSGRLPCATAIGQPTGSCAFRATRGPGGNASVWITRPAGDERYIEFREGQPVGTDPGLSLTSERVGDLTLIRIGEEERYEIPDAIVHGD